MGISGSDFGVLERDRFCSQRDSSTFSGFSPKNSGSRARKITTIKGIDYERNLCHYDSDGCNAAIIKKTARFC
jgi:hypothetical protein